MEKLTHLNVWEDIAPHDGAMNMAIDEWLLENIADMPILRFYHWDKPTVSIGYFSDLKEAQSNYKNNVTYVRRKTGGGIVDHRDDTTYSLIVPNKHPLAKKSRELYSFLHKHVANALQANDIACQLTQEQSDNGDARCFFNPVYADVVSSTGSKIAGAAIRKTRKGTLLQGSLIAEINPQSFATSLTQSLCEHWQPWEPILPQLDATDYTTSKKHPFSESTSL